MIYRNKCKLKAYSMHEPPRVVVHYPRLRCDAQSALWPQYCSDQLVLRTAWAGDWPPFMDDLGVAAQAFEEYRQNNGSLLDDQLFEARDRDVLVSQARFSAASEQPLDGLYMAAAEEPVEYLGLDLSWKQQNIYQDLRWVCIHITCVK